jgi:F420-dependent oxidoreductase-like protein
MRVGLQLPSFSFAGGTPAIRARLLEIAQAAEAHDLASLWVMDHLYQLPEESGWGGPEEPMLEAYATLGFLAAGTERIRLGALVGCAVYRAPGLLVKAVTTVDVLSGGRAYFGIGAGWYAREARGLGLPFPARRERFERLEETLQVARHLWADDRQPYAGRHHELAEPILAPQPLSRPHPPILIGGGGERRTLRLVAEYGDACNILVPDPGESRHKLEVLRRHCEVVGRPYEAIEKTSLIELDLRPGRMSVDDARRALHAQGEEGIEHVIVNLPEVEQLAQLEVLGRAARAEVAA